MPKKLSDDKKFQRGLKTLKALMETIDCRGLINELTQLHVSREVASTKSKTFRQSSLKALTDSSVDEIGARSRVTTIQITVLQTQIEIEKLTSHLSKYMIARYSKQMSKQGHSTITAQKGRVEVLLNDFHEFLSDLKMVYKIADILLADIDAASWSLNRISEVIKKASKDR